MGERVGDGVVFDGIKRVGNFGANTRKRGLEIEVKSTGTLKRAQRKIFRGMGRRFGDRL